MTVTFPVEITQEDIDQGLHHSCSACPGALALNRCAPPELLTILKEWTHGNTKHSLFLITPSYITCLVRRVPRDVPTPPALKTFIRAFDAGDPVRPITFDLTLDLP